MCTKIMVKKEGREFYCDSVGELATVLDIQPILVSPDGPEFCLCNCRLEELGARRATKEEGWPFPEYVIEKK